MKGLILCFLQSQYFATHKQHPVPRDAAATGSSGVTGDDGTGSSDAWPAPAYHGLSDTTDVAIKRRAYYDALWETRDSAKAMEVGTLTFTAEGFTAYSKARLLTEHYEGAWRFHEAIFQDREADFMVKL